MRIADVAINTGAGLKIPPLQAPEALARKHQSVYEYLVKISAPTRETIRGLEDLHLPMGVEIEINCNLANLAEEDL